MDGRWDVEQKDIPNYFNWVDLRHTATKNPQWNKAIVIGNYGHVDANSDERQLNYEGQISRYNNMEVPSLVSCAFVTETNCKNGEHIPDIFWITLVDVSENTFRVTHISVPGFHSDGYK